MKMNCYINVLRPDIREFVTITRRRDLNLTMEVAWARELNLKDSQAKKRKLEKSQAPMKKQKQSGYQQENRRDFPGAISLGAITRESVV